MERGLKDGLSACSTVSLWTINARTARDVHDLDQSKVALAAWGARKTGELPRNLFAIFSKRAEPHRS